MSGIVIDLSPGAIPVPTSLGSKCGEYNGDKDGAYAGGAIGGVLMLALAVTPVVRWWQASCAKVILDNGKSGPTWRNYVLLSLSLFLYGSGCQAYAFAADATKYGTYAIIASSGIFGGACFCAVFTMVAATVMSIRLANASLSQSKTKWIQPLLVMAWTCHMLALATLGFGAVHAYTIDGESGPFCRGEVEEARKAMYTFAGLTDLVAFFFVLLASVICLLPGKGADSALAASADAEAGVGIGDVNSEAAPNRCKSPCGKPKWDQLGFALVVTGLMMLTAATSFMRTLEHPTETLTESNEKAAFAIPGLIMMFAAAVLMIASFIKLKDAATRWQHATGFNLSLAFYAFSFTIVLYVRTDAVGNTQGIAMQRDAYSFTCAALLFAFVAAAFPTLAGCQLRLKQIKAKGIKAAVDKTEPYKSMTHHFCAAWACVLFALAVIAGNTANKYKNPGADTKGGYFIAGTALQVGFCFTYYGALFGVAPGEPQAAPETSAPRPEPRFDPATGKPITKRNSNSHFVAPAVGSPGAPAPVDGASAPKH